MDIKQELRGIVECTEPFNMRWQSVKELCHKSLAEIARLESRLPRGMDVKQVMREVIADQSTQPVTASTLSAICKAALAEIERLERLERPNPDPWQVYGPRINLRDAPKMPFGEANGFGGALSADQRLERIERFLNEFIRSNT